jgi:pilus assembly protein CpaE
VTPAIRILLVVDDGIEPGSIVGALPPAARVTTLRLDQRSAAEAAFAEPASSPELMLIGCSHRRDDVLELIEAASRLQNDAPVVVLYDGSPNGFMERAFAAGADDLITLPLPLGELGFALEKVVARRRGFTPSRRTGEIVTVLGPKGGTGKTLTACNLAVALAGTGADVALVDLDLQFGDVGLALGLHPQRTIYDLATAGGSLDGDKIDGFLSMHDTGVRALLAPLRPDQAAAVSSDFLRSVLDAMRGRHDFVIIDTPPAFSPEVIAAIDSSTRICVVGMLDALSLKDTKIGLETLAQMGYDPGDVTLVLNRADSNIGISTSDVERLLGRRPDVLVPSDRAIPRAVTEGRTIVEAEPRSGGARAYIALAESYAAAGTEPAAKPEAAPARRRSLLALGGR